MDINFNSSKKAMKSPRSLEACRQLGINPQDLYYTKFEIFVQNNPDIIRLSKELQEKRFENINKYREKMIEAVKQKREEIIEEEQDEKKVFKTNVNNSSDNRKIEILNLEKMLENIKSREEKNIEKIKQKQKNEIIGEITRNLKSKIIINKNNLKEQKVEILHALIRQKMKEKAEKEAEDQKIHEMNRQKLFLEKIKKFEKDNAKKHEGELRQLEKNQKDIKIAQRERERSQKLMNEEYEKRLQQSKIRIKENRQKIIASIEKKAQYTKALYNKLMNDRNLQQKEQKKKNKIKFEKMQERLVIEKQNREQINLKSQIRQVRYEEGAKTMKSKREKIIQKRAKSQTVLFEENQRRKDLIRDELIEKYNLLEKEMKEKEEKREKERKEKLYLISMKQEDDYLKQYEKKQNIHKLELINRYKSEKRNEEIMKKEKKLEEFRQKKNELILSKSKQADKFEKEKAKIMSDFEKNFRKKEQFNTNQLIDNLFPVGKDLSENDTKLKQNIEKLIDEMNKTDPNNLAEIYNKENQSNDKNKEKN